MNESLNIGIIISARHNVHILGAELRFSIIEAISKPSFRWLINYFITRSRCTLRKSQKWGQNNLCISNCYPFQQLNQIALTCKSGNPIRHFRYSLFYRILCLLYIGPAQSNKRHNIDKLYTLYPHRWKCGQLSREISLFENLWIEFQFFAIFSTW